MKAAVSNAVRPKTAAALVLLLVVFQAAGCQKLPPPGKAVRVDPKVRVYPMAKRTVTATVGQPAFVYAYEQTSLFPKVTGFVDRWSADIGDRVQKGQELAHVAVPELVAELAEAQAQARLDVIQIQVSRQLVEVAASNKEMAQAQAQAAEADVKKYEAGVERWTSEVERLSKITSVIDQQVIQESQKELKVSVATREAARANAGAAQTTVKTRQADVEKARTDVRAAEAKAQVSAAHVERLEALVGYTHIKAPYDGTVVDRNVNEGDYVEPAKGDFSAGRGGSNQSAGQGMPLYVVARTDKVRVYADVPEAQAAFVVAGTRARVQFEAQRGEEVDAAVTRTSWSLQYQTRTLRAEIDLPNPGGRLLPGMYAYADMVIERKDVWAVPVDATVELGQQKCVYLLEGGKAVKTPVQTGVDDGTFVEVYHKQVKGKWVDFDGSEQVLRGELSQLSDGRTVDVEPGPEKK
jgi:multidrug efflux pump subunit AcrA (membrane-fusion protein)